MLSPLWKVFFWHGADPFLLWLGSRFTARTHPFDCQAVEAELEHLKEFGAKQKLNEEGRRQLGLL